MAALAARAGTGACPYGCYEIFDEVLSVKSVKHGKPDCLRKCGNRPARAGHRQAGMGGWI
ncbi:Uncharacterized protein dnl_59340 [Desulfonema limicola]|uniref:Uncharacterized protein n=1 Tax=Desulfonema limicola TaxID=45656 RepID=A0A975BDT3_9BACT|nr:hypothetical protein [Desulfonema limicola]QTA83522.1 Uncharacterized protein dnl_59340 [Desulfonema limicola]